MIHQKCKYTKAAEIALSLRKMGAMTALFCHGSRFVSFYCTRSRKFSIT